MQRWVLLAFVVLWTSVAQAKPPRVAVAPIAGDDSGDMRDAVADALDSNDIDVLSSGKVTKAMDKIGFDGELSAKQAKKVAKELEADAIVVGKLGKSGSNKTLKFTLFVGGKKVRGFKVTFNNEKSQNFKTKLREKVAAKLEGGGGEDEEDVVATKKKKKKKQTDEGEESDEEGEEDEEEDEDAPKKKKKKKLAARDGDEDEDAEIAAAVERVSPKHSANRVAVRVDAGASFANRTLEFTQRGNFPEGPKPYRNGVVPGFRVEGEIYPLAFSNPKSIAAGLGFAGAYDRTLALSLRTTDEPNVAIPTKQYHWWVGARFRIPFGKTDTSPSVTLGVDYGKRAFSPDKSVLMEAASLDLPSTAYSSIAPGLTFRIPFAPAVALMAGGKALLISNTGPIQSLDSYGRAKVFGVTAAAGLDIVIGNRFAIRIVGELAQVGFSFTGAGEMTYNRDNDPSTKDIGGALDRSIGGSATLAVLY